MKNRIIGEKLAIDNAGVKEFFDKRPQKKLPYLLNYTNYQDNNPELALTRDECEVRKIKKYLNLRQGSFILDIGCGVGRWCAHVLNDIGENGLYVGVDYSENILKLAADNYKANKNAKFYQSSFQQIIKKLPQDLVNIGFDNVIINGVLMYINDDELLTTLSQVKKLLKDGGRLYLKESVGIKERLTLNNIYSAELTSSYSAIYRSIAEYQEYVQQIFTSGSYSLLHSGDMWEENAKNRRETTAYFWIIEKNKVEGKRL